MMNRTNLLPTVVALTLFLMLGTIKSVDAQEVRPDLEALISRIKANLRTTQSRVIGSPEPALPFRVRRVFEKLRPNYPIFAATQPGSRRLWFIDQTRSYGPTRFRRTDGDPGSGNFKMVLSFGKGVATSFAFHPRFNENGFVYVGVNSQEDAAEKMSRIVRYTIRRQPPYDLDIRSKLEVISWPSDGHNGLAIAFGLDGMMYVSSGDGSADSDANIRGQGLDHLLAKVLRINVDQPSGELAYSIPPDNPLIGHKNARAETWAYGLRNPWRMSVDSRTGDLWVGNNGQDLWEQVYLIERGANYGWSLYEGSHDFYPNRRRGPHPIAKPTFEHPHAESRSLTGGLVYYGNRFSKLRGVYLYGDYSTGKIWGAKVESKKVVWHRELADTSLRITSFSVDADGELLISNHRGNGEGGFFTLELNPPADTQAEFPRRISESGLFASVPDHEMQPGLIPYSVNAPLWSDGAHKERFIALPANDPRITFRSKGGWRFPDGTVVVKSFAIELEEGNSASRRWIETRFLARQQGEWSGYSYRWNNAQTDATLVNRNGLEIDFNVRLADGTVQQRKWRYPSRAECMFCHSRAAGYMLGLSTVQMNKSHTYNTPHHPETFSQLHFLERIGVLRGSSLYARVVKQDGQQAASQIADQYPHLVDPYDGQQELSMRVRSYLHSNCAQCHVFGGGGNSQIDLSFTTPIDEMKLISTPPLHNAFDIPNARLIAPGHPESSVLLHRLGARGRGQMPPMATHLVDGRAVQLFRRWIIQMKPTEGNDSSGRAD